MSNVAFRGGYMPSIRRVATMFVAAVSVSLGSTRTASAQSRRPVSSPDSARLAADLFFRALADEKWEVAAGMLDTAVIRRMVNERVRRPPQRTQPLLTVEDFRRDDPKKPLAVAEYELNRYREQVAKLNDGEMFAYEFSGVRSVEELRSLTTLQAAVRFLQAQDARVQTRKAMIASGCADSTFRLPFQIRRILATALANDTAAYVLHDDGMSSLMPERGITMDPVIMHLRLRNRKWVIVPTHTLLRRNGSAMSVRCEGATRR